ncbi:hypothetical protein [Clostridium felsineum]|nr:hypothetical protein [Clostridium felsineum]URZ04132.1 hypothetical protein CLAUR_042200 [Clostridium felsineum]
MKDLFGMFGSLLQQMIEEEMDEHLNMINITIKITIPLTESFEFE